MRVIAFVLFVGTLLIAACGAPQSELSGDITTDTTEAETDFSGDWAADLKVPGGPELGIILHIERADDDKLYSVTLDVPQQGAFGLEAENERVDENANFRAEFPIIGASINLKRDGDTLTGAFIQGLPLPVTFEPADDLPAPSRPQEAALVRDYVIKEVSFSGGAEDVTLAGELTMPRGDSAFPAAVLISGSGPQDRNEELMSHKPFLILADYLTTNGYAVLRYDDRGTAESTGDWDTATTQDFADDAAAALKFLRGQPNVDSSRVGYIGHSEGGFIAPLATKIEQADFMVFLAGPSQTLPDVILRQSLDMGRAGGAPEAQLKKQNDMQEQLFEAVRATATEEEAFEVAKSLISESGLVPAGAVEAQAKRISNPWMRWMIAFDPRPVIADYDGPVLALFGEKDLQVAPDANVPDMRAALTHPESVVKILPGLNHLFQPAETGAMTEYYDIEITFDEGAMEEIVAWMDSLN